MQRDLESGAVNPRDEKARLAREIITRLRGAEAAAAAEEHFDSVFRRHESAADLQELALEAGDVEDGGSVFLPAVLERWFGQTRSEWRRRIQQGGVSLDGEPVSAPRRRRARRSTSRPASRPRRGKSGAELPGRAAPSPERRCGAWIRSARTRSRPRSPVDGPSERFGNISLTRG